MSPRYGGPVPAVFMYAVRVTAIIVIVAIGVSSSDLVAGAQRTLSPREVDEAILIGQSRIAADRTGFHAPYRILVAQGPVDFIDVVTPFRRVVLAADERAQLGDRSFGQQKGLDLLEAANGQFDFDVDLTFHPLNTFVGIPAYDVVMYRGTSRILPVMVDRVPRYGARVDGLPSAGPRPAGPVLSRGSQPMLGGMLVARFAGESLDATGVMRVEILDEDSVLASVSIDLGRLR
ncbi:MAG TPA: hypothetical protein VL173_07305 [Vicinamibacterales bacterium]|nr:hypothetical protein [Vicinamibacterales bacterium]